MKRKIKSLMIEKLGKIKSNCRICEKQLPLRYLEIEFEKNKFDVCSNDCERVIWGILSNLKA